MHVKKPRRSPLRLRFLTYILEEISCASCITYFPIRNRLLLISKWLYNFLIKAHFSYAVWNAPAAPLLGILLFVFATVIAAVYAPAKRMHNMEITEIINEL
jgi:hypothetical protein